MTIVSTETKEAEVNANYTKGVSKEQLIENSHKIGWEANFRDALCPECKK